MRQAEAERQARLQAEAEERARLEAEAKLRAEEEEERAREAQRERLARQREEERRRLREQLQSEAQEELRLAALSRAEQARSEALADDEDEDDEEPEDLAPPPRIAARRRSAPLAEEAEPDPAPSRLRPARPARPAAAPLQLTPAEAIHPEPQHAERSGPARPSGQRPAPQRGAAARLRNSADWETLRTFAVDESHLERNRVISAAREDLAHTAFDVLRTRLLQALRDRGWSRVAVTSPSKDCGKTFSSANLALSLARQENCRTMLFDFDMRRPSLARVFGVQNSGSLGDVLRGDVPFEEHLRCMGKNSVGVGRNVGFGFNDRVEPYASELLQTQTTAQVLDDIQQTLGVDVMIFDMPPALYHDDVMAARNLFDGVLLVVGGGITKASEIKDVERRLGETTPLLGTVLNFAEGAGITRYSY